MPSIRAKITAAKIRPASSGTNSSSSTGIKKAITTTTKTNESSSQNEAELSEEGVETTDEVTANEKTATEKKKNLEKILKRGLGTDKKTKEDPKEKTDQEVNKEWNKNPNVKENESRFDDARKKGLQETLKYDKESIADRYSQLERPGSNSNDSGISKLSDSQSPARNNSNGNSASYPTASLGTRAPSGNGASAGVYSGSAAVYPNQQHHHGSGVTTRPINNDGTPSQTHHDSTLEKLFVNKSVEGKNIGFSSEEAAARAGDFITSNGSFQNVRVNGSELTVSGFNPNLDHEVHQAYGDFIANEFAAGNISQLSFLGVDENYLGDLSSAINERAQELGNDNLNIGSNCANGVCQVDIANETSLA